MSGDINTSTSVGSNTSASAGSNTSASVGSDTSASSTDITLPGASAGSDAVVIDEYVQPGVGPSDLAALPGPFTASQLTRIDEALTLGSRESGLLFSLYVGTLSEPTRTAAERLASRLPLANDGGIVLLAVSPGQRALHIVTRGGATKRLPNRVCALAALGMRAAFSGGDLTTGVVNGLRMLADAAGGPAVST